MGHVLNNTEILQFLVFQREFGSTVADWVQASSAGVNSDTSPMTA